jgi:uncharacterized circularly permuted ATP-grasp superfamily protein/uncharacterized alpha-E superfamily protein
MFALTRGRPEGLTVPEQGVWDELRMADGTWRATWCRFAEKVALPAAGDLNADFDRRLQAIAAQIRRDGVTHNVFGPEGAVARPWSLELLPLLIEPADWAGIERGIRQRAQLFEAVLDDVYGPQRLLHEGLLPPALVMRHPGYVRALRGVAPVGGLRLRVLAFDIARGPEGRWWVVAQRTQGPSGLGYVLHNRLLVSRQFPEAYQALRVQRIASSYRRLLDGLEEAARPLADGGAPRIALLTPGPYSETWFEQAYLARYLGLPLVEGGDLTVRGDRLFMQTVQGPEPVHGLLRRLDDDWCDPLSLRPDSTLGVPGLLRVAQAGQVVMANAIGSAFLESPAVQGFLPGLSQALTGRELDLPSLPTWWCGEAAAWADVRGRLDGKLLRSTFPRAGRTSQVHDRATVDVDQDPDAWTVQGRLRFSRAPIWGPQGLELRPAMVRVYAVAGPGGHWRVLPGGMTRVAQGEEASVSMQRGGTSLDTWVMTDGEVDTFSMLPPALRVQDIAGRHRPVSSRTAENLFWLGRYTERAEHLVRLARQVLSLVPQAAQLPVPLLHAASALAVRLNLAPPGVPTLAQSAPHFERAVLAGLADPAAGFSLAFDLQALERAALAVRERLPPEQWGLVRTMKESLAADLSPSRPDAALAALERLGLKLSALTGAQTDRMTRDAGWRLLTIGRLLERLLGLTVTLETFLASGALAAADGVDALLDLFDSTITFRARHQRHDDLLALADVLVLDDTNPRGLAGVLRRLRTELGKLPHGVLPPQAGASRLPAQGAGLQFEELQDDVAGPLLQRCQTLHAAALAVGEDIGRGCFAPAGPVWPVAGA